MGGIKQNLVGRCLNTCIGNSNRAITASLHRPPSVISDKCVSVRLAEPFCLSCRAELRDSRAASPNHESRLAKPRLAEPRDSRRPRSLERRLAESRRAEPRDSRRPRSLERRLAEPREPPRRASRAASPSLERRLAESRRAEPRDSRRPRSLERRLAEPREPPRRASRAASPSLERHPETRRRRQIICEPSVLGAADLRHPGAQSAAQWETELLTDAAGRGRRWPAADAE